jgi:hypothetical protein
MSERDDPRFVEWWVKCAAWLKRKDASLAYDAARAPLLERIAFLESVVGQSSMDLFRDNCLLRAQVEGLENKCALLAASWKKAEDELEKIRAAQPKVK